MDLQLVVGSAMWCCGALLGTAALGHCLVWLHPALCAADGPIQLTPHHWAETASGSLLQHSVTCEMRVLQPVKYSPGFYALLRGL